MELILPLISIAMIVVIFIVPVGNKKRKSQKKILNQDDSWIDRLYAWANENDIPDLHKSEYRGWNGLPRDREKLTSLTELDLTENQLTSLPAEISKLTSLTKLNLSRNKLTSLPAEIGKLTSLMELDLSGNQLTRYPVVINQLTKLTRLVLEHNQLTYLPEDIGQLTSLTELYLNENQLSSLPAEIGRLTKLTRLVLEHNQLTCLPADIGRLTSLTELFLLGNELTLTTLPQVVFDLPDLDADCRKELDNYSKSRERAQELAQLGWINRLYAWADDNDIPDDKYLECSMWALPRKRERLMSLTALCLSGYELTSLPAEIGELTSLEHLNLSDNQLTSLPAEIGQLTNLTSLDLSENQLTSLPVEIGRLTNLTSLRLNDNKLTSLQVAIGKLTSLTTLCLLDNKLTSLPAEIGRLTKLTTLLFGLDTISSLPRSIVNLPNLDPVSRGNILFLDAVKDDYSDEDNSWDEDDYLNDDYYLDKHGIDYIYHMTHYTNLKPILTEGLFPHDNDHVRTRIDNQEVNQRRDKIDPIYNKNLHTYVPFYFNPKNPMLYVKKANQDDIVILAFDRNLICKDKTIFSDGNAAKSATSFYRDLSKLNKLNWACLNANYWNDFENGKSERMAEVLVRDKVKIKHLKKVFCFDEATKSYILDIDDNLDVEINKELYF